MTTQQLDHNAGEQTLTELWISLEFPGKLFCSLNGNELVLNETAYGPQRKLADLNPENCTTVVNMLAEKFKEIQDRVAELENEWAQTEERLKFSGKIARLKDYLGKAGAIGDYTPVYKNLEEKEAEIQKIADKFYQEKLALVEQAEAIKDSEEWRETTEKFRAIVEAWKNGHSGDKFRYDRLWDRIEQARSRFYDRKRQHHESIEQEMMQNLDLKLEICEKAEKLASSEDWKQTADLLKSLMDEWKTIGKVVSPEKNEELWKRFLNARNAFFDRKKQNFEHIQADQEANYLRKMALVEQAELLCNDSNWKETTQRMAEIMEDWKKIGKVPFEKSEEIWKRLQDARDKFFSAKRQNAEEKRINLEENYSLKLALLNRAEQLQHSHEWKAATEEMNELMQEWKKIGHVPRKYGDELWEKFIAARHYFFDRKDEDREKRKSRFQNQMDSRYQQTKQFLQKIKDELREEEEKLNDFQESLKNTTGDSPKEIELRRHLENLIHQIEKKIPERKEKINEVAKQYEELQEKRNEIKTEEQAR